jgi:menaquinone-dependent protoporphyrinogen oxidase
MVILVAYASKRGGTKGLADMVADGLRAEGFTVEVEPAGTLWRVDQFDAVVVGGALYAGRWNKDARRFVKEYAHDLANRPTYLFSSGPLDDSATEHEIPPVRGVESLMRKIGARGHATFGGRLEPDATGFAASAMAKNHAGDWRDPAQVRAWAHQIADELRAAATHVAA